MKITICGSIAFYDEMLDVKERLEKLGHIVKLPPHEVADANGIMIPVKEYYVIRKTAGDDVSRIWERKAQAIMAHFEKVAWGEAILVTNDDKNGIPGYIGGNTLMEMSIAFFLQKPIYLLKAVPPVSYREEIIGMRPVIIEEDLRRLV